MAYSTTLAADNSPTSWSVVITDYDGTDITSGCGLSINSSGVLSGTPAIPAGSDGLWTVTVTASNAGGTSAAAVFTIECWRLRVDFSTDDAAPISNPYAGEFGSVTTTQTTGTLAASGGHLTYTDGGLSGTIGIHSSAYTRTAGLAGLLEVTIGTVATCGFAWNASHSLIGSNGGISFVAGGYNINIDFVTGLTSDIFNSSSTLFAIVQHSTGYSMYYKLFGGSWELLWSKPDGNAASPALGWPMNGSVGSSGIFRIVLLPPPMSALYGAATFNATSAFSDIRTGTAGAEITAEYSIPSPDAASDELSVIFRRQDASNYWQARVRRNAGDTNYDLLVDTVASGTPTNRLTVSNIGDTDALRIRADGTTIRFFTRSGTTWTARSNVTLSLYSTQTGVTSTVVQGSWSQTRLVSVPLVDATVTAILDRVTA